MPRPDDVSERPGPTFRSTLIRVIVVQVIALALLWLLQVRYDA